MQIWSIQQKQNNTSVFAWEHRNTRWTWYKTTAAEHFCSRLMEHETKLITAAVFTTVNVINNLLSVPGWRTKCFLTRRYNLPTKTRLHFLLSKLVLSIIHEMAFQFFYDPAHNTIHLPQHPSPSMHTSVPVRRECLHVLGCTRWSRRRCHRFISFQFRQDCGIQTWCGKRIY